MLVTNSLPVVVVVGISDIHLKGFLCMPALQTSVPAIFLPYAWPLERRPRCHIAEQRDYTRENACFQGVWENLGQKWDAPICGSNLPWIQSPILCPLMFSKEDGGWARRQASSVLCSSYLSDVEVFFLWPDCLGHSCCAQEHSSDDGCGEEVMMITN